MFMSAAGKCLYFKKLIFHPALMAWLQRTINQQTYLFLIQHITSNPNPVLGTTEAYTNIKLETILSISGQPLQHKKKSQNLCSGFITEMVTGVKSNLMPFGFRLSLSTVLSQLTRVTCDNQNFIVEPINRFCVFICLTTSQLADRTITFCSYLQCFSSD